MGPADLNRAPAAARPLGSLAASAAETFLLRGGVFILTMMTSVVVSRALGPVGRGEYILATLGALMVVTLGKLGLEHANVYLFGTVKVPTTRLGAQNLQVSLVSGLVGGLLLVLTPWLLPGVYGDVPLSHVTLAALTIPLMLHTQLTAGLQNISGRVTWQFRVALVSMAAQLTIVGALAALGLLDVLAALWANLIAAILSWLLVVSRTLSNPLNFGVDRTLLFKSLRHALVLHAGLILFFVQTRLAMFLVKAQLNMTSLGEYSVAVSIAEALSLGADSLAIAVLPRQTRGTLEDAARLGLRSAGMGGALVLLASLPLIIAGPQLVEFVYGPEFAASYVPLVALLPGMVAVAMQRFCGPPTLRAAMPARIAQIYFIGVFMNIGLTLWWVDDWGLLGAATATSFSYMITATLFLAWTTKLARTRQSHVGARHRLADDGAVESRVPLAKE